MPPDYAALFGPLADHTRTVFFAYHVGTRRVRYLSPAYEQLLGAAVDRIDQDLPRWLARLHPDDLEYLREQLLPVLRGEVAAVEDLELRLRHADGRRQWLALTATRSTDAPGDTLLVGTLRDITSPKEYMRNADKFNAKKNATLEILSHDLAGPLVVLQQLTAHVAAQTQDYDNPALRELLRLMEATCTDSVNLIHDFVDQEFLESANVELKLERLDLVSRLRSFLTNYQNVQHLLHKRIGFTTEAEVAYVHIDDNKFQQIINNLLSNALKFTPDGGRIDVHVALPPGRVQVQVRDTGVGIPARLQPLLFDKFTKARRPGLRGERTTGLGMSVIHTLVTLHEGRIWFESEEGAGTTFYIELPAAAEAAPGQ
ncbi:PAS domain-containing protein [Hymenobacter sp. 15J16-1T3B]|uniref:sensor histidine kinase n=1 Tax=Hymenobacter sp. 15J16-1T3B TaxID=2886941 RepID=UPI001D10C81C|nr:ATP-binding protein [Hymenobacter sp. 15J16-1T3B]MCC3160602.1 PAS domain-containing protein [Hymenobacter sp. 15J16-1T3B]